MTARRRPQFAVAIWPAHFSRRALRQRNCGNEVPPQGAACIALPTHNQVCIQQTLRSALLLRCFNLGDSELLFAAVSAGSRSQKNCTPEHVFSRRHNARTVVSVRRCQVLALVRIFKLHCVLQQHLQVTENLVGQWCKGQRTNASHDLRRTGIWQGNPVLKNC